MVRQIFKGCVIATAGPLPGQLTIEHLKLWITKRKGRFTDEFDDKVTHLLCTQEQFDKRFPRVKQALKRGRRFPILHHDWIEYSICSLTEKRLPIDDYSMRETENRKKAKQRELERIEKGKRDAEKFVNTSSTFDFYHIYMDRCCFFYNIDITRDNDEYGEEGQRFSLCLWESNAEPHLYWFTAKFLRRKGDGQPKFHRPSPCSTKWRPQMDLFMAFFEKKTGIKWEDRVSLQGTMGPEYFQYSPPTGGKPVGRRLAQSYDYCLEINAKLKLPATSTSGVDEEEDSQMTEAEDAKNVPEDQIDEAGEDNGPPFEDHYMPDTSDEGDSCGAVEFLLHDKENVGGKRAFDASAIMTPPQSDDESS